MMELTLNDSLFVLSESSDSNENSSSDPTEEPSEQHLRRKQLRLLESCNVENLTQPRKRWEEAGARTRRNNVKKANDVIVAVLDVITPGDAA